MTNVSFGRMRIGEIPRVVGTITTSALLQRFPALSPPPCEVAEVRLDIVGHESDEWLEGCSQIEQSGTPVLLTLRTSAEGGRSSLSAELRWEIIHRALPCVSAVDLEHRITQDRPLVEEARAAGKAVVASFHDFKQTPSLAILDKIIAEASQYADVVKISTFVHGREDIETLQTLLRKAPEFPLCVIGMGPLGTETRTSFPMQGSCLTYGYLDDPSAPGQLPATALMERLGKSQK